MTAWSWPTAGPGACHCPKCHKTLSTNALAKASHWRACNKMPPTGNALRQKLRAGALKACVKCGGPLRTPQLDKDEPERCPACAD